jgi:hypothetical protein
MAAFQELAAEILKGQMAGSFRRDEPLGLAIACWSIAHGLASILVEGLLDRRELAPAKSLGPAALSRQVTQLLISGLAKR